MNLHKLSDTSKVLLAYMADAAGTAQTGKTVAVTLSKNGGAFASATGAVAEVGSGIYKLTPASGDVDTLGPLVLRATATGCVDFVAPYRVVAFDPYSSTNLGLTNLDAAITTVNTAVAAISTTIGSAGAGLTGIPKTGYRLASDGVDAIAVETGVNLRQALSPILASAAGILLGAGTGTILVKGGNVSVTRITASTDVSGNRTAVTLSLPA